MQCLFGSGAAFQFTDIQTGRKITTPVVISTIQTELNLSNLKITRTPFAGKRSIPFQSVVLITRPLYENGSLQRWMDRSGTFITKDGLILTNAHVVLSDENFKVDMLTIAPTVSADEKPQPSYIAKVVRRMPAWIWP
jgi:S1-C subfamily serine protease